ncbi:MAG: UDP-N-acetylglucosamine diphosphorylase/glucosamine-1-phosphate N-acetyltransferase [Acidobacteria bacterium RIFCSPLOWO2_02_FULL_68_18]|nr:MAG: UDP-N-acetylglucosamine diphosphorylase/glucosamine-1-phosphate N-acetyltransferase [Acidobacteria bacterium RIFCSPLOWO2_02_FULL_68_18]OFW49655.1 MAG: UDP-N-acetylglucosamine diphosphorylase/glucosamine-1-phosphate N-acetyltransferase [Acidobacteria bacterium RIFCSPLOWO2_12_FULL_68_19]
MTLGPVAGSDVHVVILAAGQGTRMKSALPKVLHPVAGRSMVDHVLRTAAAISPASTTLVVGHQAETVRQHFRGRPDVVFVVQEPQLGTAHAVQQTEPMLGGLTGTIVLLSGDVPLLRPATLQRLLAAHRAARAAATVVTAVVERPYGYGRVIRTNGRIARIVEERDASPAERQVREINSGIYAFDLAPLFGALRTIAARNAQGEYYLTDLVAAYRRRKRPVETFLVEDPAEIRGVNSRTELAEVSAIMRQTKNEELMAAGVTLIDPATTYIDPDVEIGPDTVIHPGVVIQGQTRVGAACEIHASVRIADAQIADRVTVHNFCLIVGARVAAGASIGPFAHLRPETEVGEAARVGNFVELKKTSLGAGSKANHLSYLGDATIGPNVNVGAGTITCNYDGRKKSQTVIEEGAFIGSDSQLVAPVRIGKGAYVAAGSSITKDVPAGALGIARGRQRNVEGWAERRKGQGS